MRPLAPSVRFRLGRGFLTATNRFHMRTTTFEQEEKIRQLAYQIWQGRQATREEGDALSDWLKAEEELRWPSAEPK